jgi:hypothetical protein
MDVEDPAALEFLAQFEPDGEDFLYRSVATRTPIRVTAAERQAFLDAFERHAGSLKWILIGGIVASTAFMLADMSILHVQHGFYFVMAAYAASFAAYFYVYARLKHAPERLLRDRVPAGMQLNWLERYERRVAATSWRELLSHGVFLALTFAGPLSGHGPGGDWNRLWLAAAVLLFTLFGFSVFQKLRIGLGKRSG